MNRTSTQLAITASFLLLSVFPALSNAQSTAPTATQGQTQAQREDKDAAMANLNLTEDQKAQVKQIREGARSKADAVKNDSSLSADQKQTKLQEIRRDKHEQMKKVLTPEQQKQLHENMRARHEMKQQTPQSK